MNNSITHVKLNSSNIALTLRQVCDPAFKFVKNNKFVFWAGIVTIPVIDDIRIRCVRCKEKQEFEKDTFQQQQIVQKHEAEIRALKAEADAAQKAVRRVNELEYIIRQIPKGDESA